MNNIAAKILFRLCFGLFCIIIGNIISLTLIKKDLNINSYNKSTFQYTRQFSYYLIEKGYWLIYNWMKPADNINFDTVAQFLP